MPVPSFERARQKHCFLSKIWKISKFPKSFLNYRSFFFVIRSIKQRFCELSAMQYSVKSTLAIPLHSSFFLKYLPLKFFFEDHETAFLPVNGLTVNLLSSSSLFIAGTGIISENSSKPHNFRSDFLELSSKPHFSCQNVISFSPISKRTL